MSRQLIGLDFETYSPTDLKKHGLDRYVSDPDFTPLLSSLAMEDVGPPSHTVTDTIDWIRLGRNSARHKLLEILQRPGLMIVAHNAAFERAVLAREEIHVPADMFIDSAVVARAYGAAGKLESAAPQILNIDKMEAGVDLIKLFCIPGKLNEEREDRRFQVDLIAQHQDKWKMFGHYCELDALLGLRIARERMQDLTHHELEFQAVSMEMNATGWHVDVDTVMEMQRRYKENQEAALAEFHAKHNAADLNLNSLKQLKEWCADRGIKANSFDEKHVESLLRRLQKKIPTLSPGEPKYTNYQAVVNLLETKQILGGASLKKLQTILDTVGEDGRLRDQYLHCGAGQTLRTTGRSVQMQNLKRLNGEPANMDELNDDDIEWSNTKMAENLRQVFTATHPLGFLIVGDFKSVENRGLAWLAGEEWKLRAIRNGDDLYKMQASRQFAIPYSDITKDQRQFGKVGELSCGYQAGAGAVKDFAAKMGVELSEGEAGKLVMDWRNANPMIVQLWEELDHMLHAALEGNHMWATHNLPDGFKLRLYKTDTPASLSAQHPKAQSLCMEVLDPTGRVFMRRFFHGCYPMGRNVRYYKPSELKGGDLWRKGYTDQKTKQYRHYEIYGGKLAGILTQSFCREFFMHSLAAVAEWCKHRPNVRLVGQFHDEAVLDWAPAFKPGDVQLSAAEQALERHMSDPGLAVSFPLGADVKHDYRYTK